jgi:hypothetical protein
MEYMYNEGTVLEALLDAASKYEVSFSKQTRFAKMAVRLREDQERVMLADDVRGCIEEWMRIELGMTPDKVRADGKVWKQV